MSHLSTQLFHWNLPHPILVSSSPLSSHERVINSLFASGAAAVVTKTITPFPDRRAGGLSRYGDLLFNRDGYSKREISEWEHDLETLRGQRIIANIFAETPDELAKLAKRIVTRGVEIIELGLSCPTVGKDPVCFYPNMLNEFCRSVRQAVDVPILVKLLLQTAAERNREMALIAKKAGIDGICFSDTLPAVLLESNGAMVLRGPGGISGAALKPLALKALYDISDVGLVLVGIGGIHSGQDIIDYIRMGSTAVEVCSFLIKNGIQAMGNLVDELDYLVSTQRITLHELRNTSLNGELE